MLRRNRNRTREIAAPRNEPERIDLSAIAARRQQAQAAAAQRDRAAVAAVQPYVAAAIPNGRGSPLVAYLDADPLVPLRRLPVVLPPVDLAAGHDAELARLLAAAQNAHAERSRLVADWRDHEPGRPGFDAALGTYDEAAIVDALTVDRARRFAAAWCAQGAVTRAEQGARDYAARATELHRRLDDATNEIRDEIRALLTRARDRKDRRARDDALDLVPAWRTDAALYRWCVDPEQPYRAPAGDRVIPGEVAWIEYEAALALGETVFEPPTDALDRPGRRP